MLNEKANKLESILSELGGVIVAYSGGADSALMAEMAHRVLGLRSIAITADSPSLARSELRSATELARTRGWRHQVVETYEMQDDRYTSNPVDRCFWCKSALMDRLGPIGERLGYPVVLGTNVDDLSDHRPGQRAAAERGALSPFVTAGMTKADVRALSTAMGLPTSDKPASACLSSRFAYGVPVTSEGLRRIEASETFIRELGFAVVRVRDLGAGKARVEVDPSLVEQLVAQSREVIRHLNGQGFADVEIDMKGYRQGALNEGLIALGPPAQR